MRPVLTLALAAACAPEIGLTHQTELAESPVRRLEVEPAAVDFGALGPGEEVTVKVVLRNTGDEGVALRSVKLEGSEAFSLRGRPPAELRPGERFAAQVTYRPMAPYKRTGTLTFRTDEPRFRELVVPLEGLGRPPDLVAPSVDLGEVAVGCGPRESRWSLTNASGFPAEILSAELAPAPGLEAGLPEVGTWLEAGEERSFLVRWEPAAPGELAAQVSLRSNDLTPEVLRVPISGAAVYPGALLSARWVALARATDVLIAMDRSQSMFEENQDLLDAFSRFLADLPAASPDFRLGVVTGISPCFNEGLLTPDSVDLEARFLTALQGPGSLATEALLGLARDALAQKDGCNLGFGRAGHPVQVVVVSDEPEQSSEGWEALVAEMQALLADAADLHISGVLDLHQVCGAGAAGYVEAAEATDGALVDLCGAGLADRMGPLLAPSQVGVDLFPLPGDPLVSSIQVRVDGEIRPDAAWDPRRRSVRVETRPGQVVEVEWHDAGEASCAASSPGP